MATVRNSNGGFSVAVTARARRDNAASPCSKVGGVLYLTIK
jgi:hypothetical protein